MQDQTRTAATGYRRERLQLWSVTALLAAFVLFLLVLMLTGQVWRAVAYGVVALFGFMIALAVYFWGMMLFGSTLDMLVRQRQHGGAWGMIGDGANPPEHDIDPGLELFAAGILVYRIGEVKPQAYFRKVPLANARAVRPFVVARTGAGRDYHFAFVLNDEVDATRFDTEFVFPLKDAPQLVVPSCKLLLDRPRALVGQRWTLRVLSGVTVVTSFRFMFVDGAAASGNGARFAGDSGRADWQDYILPKLLDDAVKRDAMSSTEDVVLEVV